MDSQDMWTREHQKPPDRRRSLRRRCRGGDGEAAHLFSPTASPPPHRRQIGDEAQKTPSRRGWWGSTLILPDIISASTSPPTRNLTTPTSEQRSGVFPPYHCRRRGREPMIARRGCECTKTSDILDLFPPLRGSTRSRAYWCSLSLWISTIQNLLWFT